MRTLFALLIGINKYHPESNVPPLAGCLPDVENFKSFLESNFPKDKSNIIVLGNEEATYKNIVKHFGADHLLKAKEGDVVFIHYSGHGARAKSAEEFLPYFPEGMEETMVCYDSRSPGGYDLADKELAVLIDRIAATGAEVVVSLDCCHSGSGTRNLAEIQLGKSRQWEDRDDNRPLKTYLNGHFTKENWILPTSRHILLAACDKTEKALELSSHQGNFSSNLLKVLNFTKGKISYADLFTQCRIGMRRLTENQNPQFETSGYFNAFDSFLGLGEHSSSASLKVFFEKGNWQINAGAINGLPVDGEQDAEFEIFEDKKSLGFAQSNIVGVEQSTIDWKDALDESKIYNAKMISIPAPAMPVQLQTKEDEKEKINNVITKYQPIYFELIRKPVNALYKLEVNSQKIKIWRTADQLLIRTITGDNEEQMFFDAFESLEKLCKWEKTLTLDNPKTELKRGDVELMLVELDHQKNVLRETSAPEVLIDILIQEKIEQKVPFRIEAHNHHQSNQRHCALFYFSDEYGVFKMYNDTIPPKSKAILLDVQEDGSPYAFELHGENEALDIFKLVISNKKISDYLLEQQPIDVGESVEYLKTRSTEPLVLKERAIGGSLRKKQNQEDENDWYAHTMKIKSVGQKAKVGSQSIALANGAIKILGRKSKEKTDKSFTAKISLSSASNQNRSLDASKIFLDLTKNSTTELLNFGQGTRNAAASNILVLNDIENDEELQTNPLQIELDAQLNELETILPLTFDGEHLIPIGDAERQSDGKSVVSIHHIPEVIEDRRRSVFKALKLCFLKVVLKRKDLQYLSWVDYSQPKAERVTEGLNVKVRDAKNILLVIHGIIGDTQVMAESMRMTQKENDFDLVLAFDYENLNTPIQETAAALKMQLHEAGISIANGKKLTILAHSMGGLVSRCFIEKLGGNTIVEHLIMAGTPNAGATLANITKYRKSAKTLLGLAMNSVWGIPAAATLLTILKKSEKLTPTLEQMNGDSLFLKELNEGDDPRIPYTILAGHVDRYAQKNKTSANLLDKLFDKGATLFYGQSANDVAVTVNSILSISKSWNPQFMDVACHHMNYFINEESLEILKKILIPSKKPILIDEEEQPRLLASRSLKVAPPKMTTIPIEKINKKSNPEILKEKSNKMSTQEKTETNDFTHLIQWLEQNKKVKIKTVQLNDPVVLESMNWKDLKEVKTEIIPQLKAYQRLLKILPEKNNKLILKLLQVNIHSAIQVASMSKQEFLKSYAAVFTSKKFTAEMFYNRSLAIKTKLMLNHIRSIS